MTTSPRVCAQCSGALPPGGRVCPECRALQPAPEVIAPNVVLDRGTTRIVVDAKIGEGAMGTVWRAWVFPSPRPGPARPPWPIALKVLREHPMPAARDLFVREAETLRRLSHPNIVGCGELFEHQSRLVLSLEYVDGETLESIIARHRARARLAGGARALPCMPFLRSWHYFQQLLGALAAVHAMRVVHRDIKPSNVLVRRDGLVKLGDFGIARVDGTARLAATSQFAPGTGAYMSPEQVLSMPLDGRSDLYSAATVLYEMLAGTTPFSAEKSEFLVRRDQVEAIVPPIRSWLPQAPPVLDALFGRALAKDPEFRFDSAIEMGDAFRTALGIDPSPEWTAQADIARVARTIADAGVSSSPRVVAEENRLATLREFVALGYKTKKFGAQ